MLGFALGEVAIGEIPLGGGPVTTVSIGWYSNLSIPVRVPERLTTGSQTAFFETIEPQVVLPTGWLFQYTDPKRFKPSLKTALQAFLFQSESAQFPETISEDRWHEPWSEPKRFRLRLSTGDQPYFQFQPSPVVSFGWNYPYTDPKRFKKQLRADLQQAWVGLINPVTVTPYGWLYPYTDPKRFKRALKTGDQPYFQFDPVPFVSFGWYARLSEPKRFKKRLAPGDQPYFSFYPNPLVRFDWIFGYTDPKRFKLGLRPDLQQTEAFVKIVPVIGPRKPLYKNAGAGFSYWPGDPPYGGGPRNG